MIDKRICTLCTWNGKCKHISNCKSNELGVKVAKATTESACEALYVLQDELNADLMNIEKAKEIMRKEMEK